MYGKSAVDFPRRIVCLTAETRGDRATLLGAGDRVVGVPGTARRPEAARGQAAGGRLHDLPRRPDPRARAGPGARVLGSAGATSCAELIRRRAWPCSAPTSARSTTSCGPSSSIGGALGREAGARALVLDMRDEITPGARVLARVARSAARLLRGVARSAHRGHPLGVGADRDRRAAATSSPSCASGERAASAWWIAAEVVRRDPQIILASWCGKPVDLAAIAARPGWDRISRGAGPASTRSTAPTSCAPGPSLLHGLRRIHEIMQDVLDARD